VQEVFSWDVPVSFLNRVDELAMLRTRLSGKRGELLVVYGRRRVGKTELLAHLAATTRSVYYEATDSVVADQLRDLTAELARSSADELLTAQPLTSWEAALTAIAHHVGDRRTLVVLDEFQLLAAQAPELETVLSRWWRTTGRHLPITLILAGSEVSFFEDSVLAGSLYGRRTGQLKLTPFLARDAALFHPAYHPEDRVRTYAVCGGIPYYLERFTDDRPLREHLLQEVLLRAGLLHEEAELMLRQSLTDPTNHVAVLRAIAGGRNRVSLIANHTLLTVAHVSRTLDTLERLALVERMQPATASTRTRKTAYAIADQFLRFHFRFVEPARSQLRTRALAEAYLSDIVLPHLDQHTSYAWEEISRQYVLTRMPGVHAVGRWWGQIPTGDARRTEEREVDVVAVDGDRRPIAAGMCQWTTQPVDFAELNLLDRLLPHLSRDTQPDRFLFSRSGFTDRVAAHAAADPTLHLVTPADIYT
jgi:uncharacterized protein